MARRLPSTIGNIDLPYFTSNPQIIGVSPQMMPKGSLSYPMIGYGITHGRTLEDGVVDQPWNLSLPPSVNQVTFWNSPEQSLYQQYVQQTVQGSFFYQGQLLAFHYQYQTLAN